MAIDRPNAPIITVYGKEVINPDYNPDYGQAQRDRNDALHRAGYTIEPNYVADESDMELSKSFVDVEDLLINESVVDPLDLSDAVMKLNPEHVDDKDAILTMHEISGKKQPDDLAQAKNDIKDALDHTTRVIPAWNEDSIVELSSTEWDNSREFTFNGEKFHAVQ